MQILSPHNHQKEKIPGMANKTVLGRNMELLGVRSIGVGTGAGVGIVAVFPLGDSQKDTVVVGFQRPEKTKNGR